ncbi:MAG: DHH family phosphoesterase, partial [Coriobacteriales bacterium]|nr:DHH family phosphoesterase [Coriobacteriales bacterium]
NPDGDAIGSVIALALFLEQRGLKVTRLLARETAAPQQFSLMGTADFVAAAAYTDTPDIFVAVDLSQSSRLDKAQAVLARTPTSVIIDHHPNPDNFADYLLHDSSAAATGLLIWDLIQYSGVAVTAAMASACYLAILTDTGRFTFQNTNQEVLIAAAQMVQAGADPAAISKAVYDTRAIGALRLDARLIERIDYLVADSVVYSWVTRQDFKDFGVALDESEHLINILRSVAGSELAILLREDDIQVRVNLRSRGDYNAAKLAIDHGGGGHQAAAGFNFAGTIDQAREAIKHYLESEGVLTGGKNHSESIPSGGSNQDQQPGSGEQYSGEPDGGELGGGELCSGEPSSEEPSSRESGSGELGRGSRAAENQAVGSRFDG